MSVKGQEFHPEQGKRNSEVTAWSFVAIVCVSLLFVYRSWGWAPFWGWVFIAFLLFAALSISLGNWVDRQTVIKTDDSGIFFRNGLRQVQLDWRGIEKVIVFPAHWGQTIQVRGKDRHFEFKTLGEIKFQGQVAGRVGFPAGEEILVKILKEAGLSLVEKTNRGRYYSR